MTQELNIRTKISQTRFAMRDPILGMDTRHDDRCRKRIASLVDQLRELALASESHCAAAGTADEKPDGQAENELLDTP